MKNILAVDLGTNTGYAYNSGERFFFGHWKLATAQEVKGWGKERITRRRDPRPQRLCDKILKLPIPDILVYEDVAFMTSLLQVQLWSALRTSLWMCLGPDVFFDCVHVQSLKKFAIAGNATKEMMRDSLSKKHPELFSIGMTEDEVDAAWIWLWAKHNLSRTKI